MEPAPGVRGTGMDVTTAPRRDIVGFTNEMVDNKVNAVLWNVMFKNTQGYFKGKKKSQTLIWKDRLILRNIETTTVGTDWTSEKCLSDTDSSDTIHSTFGPSCTSKLHSLIGQLFLSSMPVHVHVHVHVHVCRSANECLYLSPSSDYAGGGHVCLPFQASDS